MKVCMVAGDAVDYVFSLVQALAQLGVRIELLGGGRLREPKVLAAGDVRQYPRFTGSQSGLARQSDESAAVLRPLGRTCMAQ